MYQTIDEINPESEAASPPSQTARYFITLIVIIGFAVMLSAAIWAYNQDNSITPHPAQQSESIDGFRRIQAEPRRAIRRALLIDYIKAHPQSPVLGGAQQQLRVMNDYEAADWAELSDIIFDDTLPILDKQFALDRYIVSWGEGLVGSRDSDIIAFKSSLATALEAQNGTTPPSRKFIPEKSPIPDNITASQMVGGRVVRRIRPTYPALSPRHTRRCRVKFECRRAWPRRPCRSREY